MSRLVVINLGSGDLSNGYRDVTAQISLATGGRHPAQCRGSLPPAPEIAQLYRNWQLLYREFYRERRSRSAQTQRSSLPTREIAIEPGGVTNFSEVEFRHLCQQLKTRLNAWLNSESFHPIDRRLSRELDSADEIRLILATDDELLRRLPWHLWNFFEDYPRAELAISALEYGQVTSQSQTPAGQVRILAILGNSDGIDLQADRQSIEALPGAASSFLESPSRRRLNEYLWNKQSWDILFFAGHSQTEAETGAGQIQLNSTDSLTLEQLRNALKRAISHGLKLAIFNSCDGLGLARDLADLHIPQVIVMREPVPDRVAQEFFKQFLEAFSQGQSLYAAAREARERLEKLEDEYPCATWLPAICQNPAATPATWQQWRGLPPDRPSSPPSKPRLLTVLLASLGITALVMGGRQLGVLQRWELHAYDQLMQQRPDERQDQRLLVITITEEDFQLPEQQQRVGARSLSDPALAKLLEKLASYQPRAIGLDLYRPDAENPIQPDLAKYLRSTDNFFAICRVGEASQPGISPPPEVPPERQGFSDVIKDADGILRRHLLAMQPDPEYASRCPAYSALSAQLAFNYLEKEGVSAQYTEAGELQVGKTRFKRLPAPRGDIPENILLEFWRSRRGGYQRIDAWGYQILLNYRSHHSPLEIAPVVTLTDVLRDRINPERIKDRIVLIGVTAPSAGDFHATPYSTAQESYQPIPGVILQAQMTSQILSAVLDGRPLLSVWPLWGEVLWVWGWSVVAGLLIWRGGSRLYLVLGGGIALGGLYLLCWGLFIQGIWVPLIPAALALGLTGSSIAMLYTVSSVRRQESFEF